LKIWEIPNCRPINTAGELKKGVGAYLVWEFKKGHKAKPIFFIS
jgi:hypothetical protein